MSPHDPKKSLEYLLGSLDSKMDSVLEEIQEFKATVSELETRVLSLEKTGFKVYTIITTIAAVAGFLGSHIKEGLEWMLTSPQQG